jgi:hypothetical protein
MYPALLIFGLVRSAVVIFVQITRAGVSAIAYHPITLFAIYFELRDIPAVQINNTCKGSVSGQAATGALIGSASCVNLAANLMRIGQ